MARLVEVTHSLRWLAAVRRKLRRKRSSPHVQHPVQVCSLLCTALETLLQSSPRYQDGEGG